MADYTNLRGISLRANWRPASMQVVIAASVSIAIILASCSSTQPPSSEAQVVIEADNTQIEVAVQTDATVQEVLEQTQLALGDLDQVDPSPYTLVSDGMTIQITRIEEEFLIEEQVIPFVRQSVRNESLPEGETRLLQAGQNGLEEVTFRMVIEEGIEIARTTVKRVILEDPIPEIVMLGSQDSYSPIAVSGTLAYESAGNAWVIRGDTGARRPLVTTGDLDGFIFELSPDGRWLLYTRAEESDEIINSLWVISTIDSNPMPLSLRAQNIIHFADWTPAEGSLKVAYSTVEPSLSAPGWQANNDLILSSLNASGRYLDSEILIEANAGGQYGWWGTEFAWAPEGDRLAYARADAVGVIDLAEPGFIPLREITPFQTFGDWAWVPNLSWADDGRALYAVDHGEPIALEGASSSPVFDLVAFGADGGKYFPLVNRSGMFSFPSVSPTRRLPSGEFAFEVAYLSAITPLESQDSSYRLVVMDRDGSNPRVLFPAEGDPGIQPPEQAPAWSPDSSKIAFVHRNDLWVVEEETGLVQRLTADGQTSRFDWKP